MYFKNVKEKINFIDKLCEDDNQSIQKKIPVLFQLSKDKNTDVRINLASELVLFDHIEIEDILYYMLFDKNRMVRLEALDSLSVGRQQKTIEKVKSMLDGEGQLIRAYAVFTLFHLITNCYGFNEEAFERYNSIAAKSFSAEKDPRVLIEYYQNQYYINNKQGMQLLERSYIEAVEKEKYNLIWPLLHIFQEIQNTQNREWMNKVLEYKAENLLPAQKELMDKITSRKVLKKVLIIDNDDVHLYDYVVCVNTLMDRNRITRCKVLYYDDIDISNDQQIMDICENIEQKLCI